VNQRHRAYFLSIISLAIVVAVVVVYWPVRGFDFVRIDDADYVWKNDLIRRGLTWEGFRWAFTTGHTGNWHPLAWLSHMADCAIFGVEPAGPHHLVNVALHASNAVLLLLLLWRMTGAAWRSAMVAALFALHPLRVESVAWVAERKDVLSTLFGLLTLLIYVQWVRLRRIDSSRRSRRLAVYVLMMACFGMSLLSKPMLVTLPFVLLLLDFWPLKRFEALESELGDGAAVASASNLRAFDARRSMALILEKLPLLLLSAISSAITFIVQNKVGAVADVDRLPIAERIGNALVSYVRYVGKSIWPGDLVLQYPHPMAWPAWAVLASGTLIAAITVVAVATRRACPWLIVGWLWFLGTLVPVIGLVQVGTQAMADRYSYVPQIGLLIMVVWAAALLVRGPVKRPIAAAACVVILSLYCVKTRLQVMVWRDTQTLAEHAVAISPENWLMQHLLGLTYLHMQRPDLAARQFEIAGRLNPNHAEIASNLGDVLMLQGRAAEAIKAYQRALELEPDRSGTLNNSAVILCTNADANLRNGPMAVMLARRACELTHFKNPDYVFTLAAAHAEASDFDQAVRYATDARELAVQSSRAALVSDIDEKLKLFRAGRPSREMFLDPETAK
jgi:hypothetical protein